jgi:hypothetical protein
MSEPFGGGKAGGRRVVVSKKKRMTERQWLACGVSGVVWINEKTEPHPMLAHLEGRAGYRKLRLFACACCRRIAHLMEGWDWVVELAERYAVSAREGKPAKDGRSEPHHVLTVGIGARRGCSRRARIPWSGRATPSRRRAGTRPGSARMGRGRLPRHSLDEVRRVGSGPFSARTWVLVVGSLTDDGERPSSCRSSGVAVACGPNLGKWRTRVPDSFFTTVNVRLRNWWEASVSRPSDGNKTTGTKRELGGRFMHQSVQ